MIIKIISGVAMIATIAPWIYPEDFDLKFRIIIPLVVALLISMYHYFESLWCGKKREKHLNDRMIELEKMEQKHKALSIQYEIKKNEVENYKNAVNITQQLLAMALSRTKEQKLDELAKGIMFCFSNVEKENDDV
ncbi:MAG: hypothetical protein FWF81_04505 [Defluviitaleaceae bacterium]|nr:hypothetical protein [Defluviitaleaceae bacterium]